MSTEAKKDLILYTQGTPNGFCASIYLEELKHAYGGPDYEVVPMSIRDADIGKEHFQVKSPWYLEINPNGRIPALTHKGFNVFETSAILLYISQLYDKEHKFSADPIANPQEYSEDLQWIFFAHGGIGPMQGQAGHFAFAAPEKIQYGITRYLNETKRLYGVLEIRLQDRDWLVGPGRGRFGIADIKSFTWVKNGYRVGVDMSEFPRVSDWLKRIDERPGVQAGFKVPAPK